MVPWCKKHHYNYWRTKRSYYKVTGSIHSLLYYAFNYWDLAFTKSCVLASLCPCHIIDANSCYNRKQWSVQRLTKVECHDPGERKHGIDTAAQHGQPSAALCVMVGRSLRAHRAPKLLHKHASGWWLVSVVNIWCHSTMEVRDFRMSK